MTGLCECGCGQKAPISDRNDSCRGYVKGQPRRFIQGHSGGLQRPVRYVVDENGCWIWQLADNGAGYGVFRSRGKQYLAHRHYYELAKGPIPDGLVLDHLCRVTRCCNPDHLEPVTYAENAIRGLPGKHRGVVDEIRAKHASGQSTYSIAKEYGMGRATAWNICNRKTYA